MAINCSSPDRFGRNTVAALLSLAITLSMLLPSAHAQDCWRLGPGQGGQGLEYPLGGSTMWDPDGPGPLPATMVVGPMAGIDHVQRWDGSAWVPLGELFNVGVRDLEVYNGELYASGGFSQIGAAPINGIARWNGTQWVQVGTGLGLVQGNFFGLVRRLQVHGGLLYLGGTFEPPGSNSRIDIIAWNGSAWVTRPQANINIMDLHTFNGDLYAAGLANSDGGVYRFTGSSWQLLGGMANGEVTALASHNSQLYAGGRFTVMNGISASRIARWNGSAWSPLGGGVSPSGPSDNITRLFVYNSQIYASGNFEYMNGLPMKNIARWDGLSTWSPLGSGIVRPTNGFTPVHGFEIVSGELVVYGHFTTAGAHSGLGNIARWNGTTWLPMPGSGLNARIRTFLPASGFLFAGGDFAFLPPGGSSPANGILSTSGAGIGTLSQAGFHGVSGNVNALAHLPSIFNPGTVVAGGFFTSAGGVAASNIARFNLLSQQWSAMGQGFNGAVSAMTNFGGSIYAAGPFTASGATALPGIARWTGSAWVSPGNWTLGSIVALGTYDNSLLISRISPSAHGVSSFDGTTLTTLGIANGTVRAFAAYEGDLIVGGNFTTMNGIACRGIARRSRITGVWSQVGQGFQIGGVRTLVIHQGQLYAGGSFISTVPPLLERIARFDGNSWVSINSGVDNDVWALASYGERLHIGGDFSLGFISSTVSTFSPYWLTSICGCLANCDNSATSPILNIDDFTCFINSFASAQSLPAQQQIAHYANCDRSSIPPVLNVDDFTCFINRFAIGCP
jgi:trimeric autotransporter adhesin